MVPAAVAAPMQGGAGTVESQRSSTVTLKSPTDHPVLQMVYSTEEIKRYKGMRFDDFRKKHPGWIWSESRLKSLMYDENGCIFVRMWDPDYGVGIGYPDDLTPEAAEFMAKESEQALADVAAGLGDIFEPDAPDD